MTLGWANPLPFHIGGGPTPTELVYAALRSAAGESSPGQLNSGAAGGLRDLWTICKATAIAASMEGIESALDQAFPQTMSAHLEVWERLLGIPRAANDVERRRLVQIAWTAQIDATTTGLRDNLRKIDPAFDVESLPWAEVALVQFGKLFEQLPGTGGQDYGTGVAAGRTSTEWPNFSDTFVQRIRYVLPPGIIDPPQASIAAAEALLNEHLPAWVDFEIYVLSSGPEGDGFYLDGGPNDDSRLSMTGF